MQLSCSVQPVPGTPSVLDRIFTENANGTLLINIGDGTPTVGERQVTSAASPYRPQTLLSAVPPQGPAFDFAATHAHLLNLDAWDGASPTVAAAPYGIPYFPSASEPHGRQGIAQLANRSAQAGVVRIMAVDDSGRRYGPLGLFVDAHGTVQIDSDDLENGNADKGLFGGTGAGVGDWRLELSSGLEIEALSYVRSWDGVLSAMHDVVPGEDSQHRVPIFNPASDWDRESRLRLINPGAQPAEVAIVGIDSLGISPATGVSVTVPAGASLTYTAAELESGRGAGLHGSLGEGTGAWQLIVTSGQPLLVMNLLASPTGHLTNLSTAPLNESQGIHAVPLFPAMSDPSGRQGLVRVINRTGTAGDVRIEAFDDTQWDYAPLTLPIGPGEAVQFDANDLEQGNPTRGLVGGTGPGQGDWRLELTSDLDIEVLSYVRAWDGLLTSMHDVVPGEEDGMHRVSMFNAEGYQDRENRLRLINPGRVPAEVMISGVDAAGQPLGDGLTATVPAGASRTYTAGELAVGVGAGLQGSLGGATGEWHLSVGSEQPIRVMNLFASPTGHLTNLSTAPLRALETALLPPATDDTDPPAEETPEHVFESEVSPIVQAQCILCHMQGRAADEPLSRLQFSPDTVEGHVALNLAVFEALLEVLEGDQDIEDPVAYILNKVQGVSHGGGPQLTAGTENFASLERFLGLLGEAVAPVGITPETLFEGVTMESARSTLRRAAIVFAGRVPSDAEYAAIEVQSDEEDTSEDRLRATIRGLMTGPGFHEFLIRASNDRLLTDRELGGEFLVPQFVDHTNMLYDLSVAAAASGNQGSAQRALEMYDTGSRYGTARAPLELIAHVIENDLPYTEILTADYIMANSQAAISYGAATEFADPTNPHDFQPSRIVSYYRKDDSQVIEKSLMFGPRVIDAGDLATDYPHAGILNTTVFLLRYPSTATNRNRARSRWTYYHFLGLDIEKSASRTTDPVALADTNNPTMHNPACTVCHTVLDPVAGAFQNYGDEGYFRDQGGGMDSLDSFYKDGDTQPSINVEVDAESTRETPDVVSASGWLAAGSQEIGLRTLSSIGHTNIHVDYLKIRDDSGTVVQHIELEELGHGDRNWDGTSFEICCQMLIVPIDVPSNGTYSVETSAWLGYQSDEAKGRPGTLSISIGGPFYRRADTWYRDMRKPGFDGGLAPSAENSLQWLADQIVADSRFAEATVKFWWPAIMGAEVAEPPEDEGDAGFDGLLLASNAQAAEVTRLADGFRSGFHEGSPYNLKDLLVEIVLSSWFRAESVSGEDPVRAIGLGSVGARRLLTPEELARKTLALTGFQWGSTRGARWGSWGGPWRERFSNLTDSGDGYALLYGGIDSDGITERARELTSVMAGVAKSHALQSSYPIVMREFFLLPEEKRLLFAGVDTSVSPTFEFGDTFGIEADSWEKRETVSIAGTLSTGDRTIRLRFVNDFYDDDAGADRNIRLDRLVVRDSAGESIYSYEFENRHEDFGDQRCGDPSSSQADEPPDHFVLWDDGCIVEMPVRIPRDDSFSVEVVVWADQAGDALAGLQVVVEADATEGTAGSRALKAKLVELYDKLHGIQVTTDSPEVLDAYELFVEVWERKRGGYDNHFLWNDEDLDIEWASDRHFFDGIADDLWQEDSDENGFPLGWDWDRIREFFHTVDWSDPQAVARTWTVVLAYLMMDYRYLYL